MRKVGVMLQKYIDKYPVPQVSVLLCPLWEGGWSVDGGLSCGSQMFTNELIALLWASKLGKQIRYFLRQKGYICSWPITSKPWALLLLLMRGLAW